LREISKENHELSKNNFLIHLNLAKLYKHQYRHNLALKHANEALQSALIPKDSVEALLQFSRIYRLKDGTSVACKDYVLPALDISKRHKLNDQTAFVKIELARIEYSSSEELNNAHTYLEDVADIVQNSSDEKLKGEYFYQKSRVAFRANGKVFTKEIIQDVEESIQYFEQVKEYKEIATALDLLGSCYVTSMPDTAQNYYEQSIKLKEKLNDNYGLIETYNNLAAISWGRGQKQQTIDYLIHAAGINEKIDAYEKLVDVYGNIGMAYEAMGKPKQSIDYYRKMLIAKDTLSERQQRAIIDEAQVKYNTLEIKKDNKIKEQNIFFQRTAIVLLLLFATLITYLLHQKNRLNTFKNQLFSIMGHDLRGMMASAYAAKRSIERTNKKTETQSFDKPINKMGSVIDGLNGFIENMLYWGFAQTNRMSIERETLDITQIIKEVVKNFQYDLERKNIHIEKDIPTDIHIQADRQTTKVVLRNLLSNAIKFSPINSEILISAQQNGQYNLLSVKDSGAGIPPEKIPLLFVVSKEKVTKGTDGEKGMGMGLWLCKEMMAHNKGKITVESTPTEDTCFTLHFPKI